MKEVVESIDDDGEERAIEARLVYLSEYSVLNSV